MKPYLIISLVSMYRVASVFLHRLCHGEDVFRRHIGLYVMYSSEHETAPWGKVSYTGDS